MKKPNPTPKSPQQRGKSSTLDILGATNGKKSPSKWAEQHQRLSELRERILQEKKAQSATAQEEFSTFSEHMADAATDSYDRDCALALLSSAQEALYEVDQALNRIAQGTYGICELSGTHIEPDRLKAIPWTRFSLQAQTQLETRGLTQRAHLGPLGSLKGQDAENAGDEDEEEAMANRDERQAA